MSFEELGRGAAARWTLGMRALSIYSVIVPPYLPIEVGITTDTLVGSPVGLFLISQQKLGRIIHLFLGRFMVLQEIHQTNIHSCQWLANFSVSARHSSPQACAKSTSQHRFFDKGTRSIKNRTAAEDQRITSGTAPKENTSNRRCRSKPAASLLPVTSFLP